MTSSRKGDQKNSRSQNRGCRAMAKAEQQSSLARRHRVEQLTIEEENQNLMQHYKKPKLRFYLLSIF